MKIHSHAIAEPPVSQLQSGPSTRRHIIKYLAGAALIAPLSLHGAMQSGRGVNLGSGDTGLMNYALTLEALEAEFYILVLKQPYAGMSRDEAHVLRDIRDHEIVHREFFRRALGANAIAPLEYNFRRVDFSDRTSVLSTARTFEDLGVAAYNGAANAIRDPQFLEVAGKIVSVEARHASIIRDLIKPNDSTFAPAPLDAADGPRSVLRQAAPFITTQLDASQLPDS